MPDEETNEEQEASGGKGGLVALLATALVSLGAGAGGAWFLKPEPPPAAPPAAGAAVAGPVAANAAEAGDEFRKRIYPLESFVVNISGEGYTRYLKVKVELETSRPDVRDELAARLPQVRDTIIVLLSSKRLADVTDFEGKALLKDDIRLRVNDLLQTGEVRSVLFTEFVVQ